VSFDFFAPSPEPVDSFEPPHAATSSRVPIASATAVSSDLGIQSPLNQQVLFQG
jgi:hypothetical protein